MTSDSAPLSAHASLIACTILIVDDNRDAADSLAALLAALGAATFVAYDGEAALACPAQRDFDAIVLDIGLPGMDRCEVARRILDSTVRRPRLVTLTGWGQDADRARIAAAGFDHHLLKPVDLRRLLEILAPTAAGRSQGRALS